MTETHNLKEFGEKIKNLRSSLGFTQQLVSHKTGINIDTLRRIENGYSLPRHDTLVFLSLFYKTDLNRLLLLYQNHNILWDYIKELDKILINKNVDSLNILYDTFMKKHHLCKNSLTINSLDMIQIGYLHKATIFICSGDYGSSYSSLIHGLQVTISNYNILKYDQFQYNCLEMRILHLIPECLTCLTEYDLSTNISKYILQITESSDPKDSDYDILIIRSNYNISSNYLRLTNYLESLKYSQRGISHALSRGHLGLLHKLYHLEAVAYCNLNNPLYKTSLKNYLTSLELYNNSFQSHETLKSFISQTTKKDPNHI